MPSVSEIVKSIFARMLFTGHSLLAIWWVVEITSNQRLWFLFCILIAPTVEMLVTLIYRKGKEYKWFSPSIFCHLTATIPCAWILELHLHQQRDSKDNTLTASHNSTAPWADVVDVTRWTDLIEQTTMLLLIIGRWLLPKAGSMTRDSLSQLLLINVAMCADISEFFDLMKLNEAKTSKPLTIAILVLWTWSLMQFPFNATAKLETEIDSPSTDYNKVAPENQNNNNSNIPYGTPQTKIGSVGFSDDGQRQNIRRHSRDVRRLAGHVLIGEEEMIGVSSLTPSAHNQRVSLTSLEHVGSRNGVSRDHMRGRLSVDIDRSKGLQVKESCTIENVSETQGQQRNFQPTIHRPSIDIRSLKDRPVHEYKTEIDNDEESPNGKPSRVRSDMFSIILSLFMQDGPFLTFRLFVIAHYRTIEYMILFLTVKNALVLVIQVYRLCILYCPCHDHHDNDFSPENKIDASSRLKNVQVAISHEETSDNNAFIHSDRLRIQWKRTTLNKIRNPLVRPQVF